MAAVHISDVRIVVNGSLNMTSWMVDSKQLYINIDLEFCFLDLERIRPIIWLITF